MNPLHNGLSGWPVEPEKNSNNSEDVFDRLPAKRANGATG